MDDMSVVEWLTTTRWELEMSVEHQEGREPAAYAARCCPRLGAESTTCEELAWSLVEQAALKLQCELYRRKVPLAA